MRTSKRSENALNLGMSLDVSPKISWSSRVPQFSFCAFCHGDRRGSELRMDCGCCTVRLKIIREEEAVPLGVKIGSTWRDDVSDVVRASNTELL